MKSMTDWAKDLEPDARPTRMETFFGPAVFSRRAFTNNGRAVTELVLKLRGSKKRLVWGLSPIDQEKVGGKDNPLVYADFNSAMLSGEDSARDQVKAEFSQLYPEGEDTLPGTRSM